MAARRNTIRSASSGTERVPTSASEARAQQAFARGSELYDTGNYAAAAAEFASAIRARPTWAEAWANRAECLRSTNDLGRALRGFNRAIRLKPELALAYLGRGVVQRRLGKAQSAVRSIQRAVELDPSAWRNWTCLAEALHDEGKRALAVAVAEKAVQVDATASDAHFTLGNLRMKSGDVEGAEKAFEKAAEVDPGHAHARSNIAVCRFLSGDIEGALRAQLEALPVVQLSATAAEPSHVGFDRQLARTALLALKEALDRRKVEFFLVAGTLLGLVRERDFLAHDKDIDIGLFDTVSPEAVREALLESGEFDLKADFAPEKRYFTAYFRSMPIDFFRYASSGSSYVFGFNENEGGVTWKFERFPLTVRRFFGAEFKVPDPPQRYLEQAYGDWRVPRRHFDPVQSSPARDRQSGDRGALYLTLNKVFMAVIEGRYALALEYLRQASNGREVPDEVRQLRKRLTRKVDGSAKKVAEE